MTRPDNELTKVGDLPLTKSLVKKYATTRARFQFVEAAVQIGENPDKVEAAYLARQLVLCTLPHANPGDVPVFTRRSGAVTLTLVPHLDPKTGKSIGFPYGSIPRLLLFWITTEAIRTKSRRLELGRSLSEFMRTIGLNPDTGRGKRGDAKRLAEQARRLFRSTISFEIIEDEGDTTHETWEDMQVAPRGEFWWSPKAPAQGALWGSWIELGESFYEAITAAPVPFDMRALRALKRSPLALDLYAWACYTAFAVIAKGVGPQFVSWTRLIRQFGAGYTSPKEFQRKAQAALRKVALVYPGLQIKPQPGGFTIHASRLAFSQRPGVEGAGKSEARRLRKDNGADKKPPPDTAKRPR
jgi:hypothetical protein